MKIRVTKIGKPSFKEAQSWVDTYYERLRSYSNIEVEVLKDNVDDYKLICQSIEKGGIVVALDERGKEFTSIAFSQKIQEWTDNPQIKYIHFIIGGPYGLSKESKAKAQQLWGLSPLTMQGDLAWLVASEQIYRAYNILHGTGYHHS